MFNFEGKPDPIVTAFWLNNMRALKGLNKGDLWLEAYQGHIKKRGDEFFDVYHILIQLGVHVNPKNILEIGTRTGISICNLLSACPDFENKKIVLCDLFNDGLVTPGVVKMNLRHFNIPTDNIEFIAGDSKVTIPKYKEDNPDVKFDSILVDGGHDFETAKTDLDNVVDLVGVGGVILFDDIAGDGCGLLPVWNSFKETNKDKFQWFENLQGKGVGMAIRNGQT